MKLLALFNTLIVLSVLSGAALSGGTENSSRARDENPWNLAYSVDVNSGTRTSIRLVSEDSTTAFSLFDGLLDRDCAVVFITQPQYWTSRDFNDSTIMLPLPVLVSGRYFLEIVQGKERSLDTIFIMK